VVLGGDRGGEQPGRDLGQLGVPDLERRAALHELGGQGVQLVLAGVEDPRALVERPVPVVEVAGAGVRLGLAGLQAGAPRLEVGGPRLEVRRGGGLGGREDGGDLTLGSGQDAVEACGGARLLGGGVLWVIGRRGHAVS